MTKGEKVPFPYQALVQVSRALESGNPDFEMVVDDFVTSQQFVQEKLLSEQAQSYLDAYGPVMDRHLDLDNVPKPFHPTYRLACASMMHNVMRQTRQAEATLAGTSLPTFTRQKLLLVNRLFPKLRAPQLFGFLPMSGPTARVNFRRFTYGNTP